MDTRLISAMDTDDRACTSDFQHDETGVLKRRRFDQPFKARRSVRKLTPTEAKRQLFDFYAALDDCAYEYQHDPSWPYPLCNPHEVVTLAVSLPPSCGDTTSGSLAWSEC